MFDQEKFTMALVSKIISLLLALPRWQKRVIVVASDATICFISILLAYSLRLGEWTIWDDSIAKLMVGAFLIWLPIFYFMGVYQTIFRYAGSGTMIMLAKASTLLLFVFAAFFLGVSVTGVPRTMGILFPVIFFLGLGLSRIVARYVLYDLAGRSNYDGDQRKVVIFGAGSAGQQLALSIRHEPSMELVAYLDDDKRLSGQTLDGTKIYYSRVQTLPQAKEILSGKITIGDLREIQIEDLLGREPVPPNELLLGKTIIGKTVMVTGAGGSIGSELCRQIAKTGPSKLILVEMTEHALYAIEGELRNKLQQDGFSKQFEIETELINLAIQGPVDNMIARHKPDTIFHAAAYKHVPLVEENIISGLGNNILSALYTATAAKKYDVSNYILVSTDKAVRPTNVMGASKRVCEQILQALAHENNGEGTVFAMVRFGNVLGSSGSVVL